VAGRALGREQDLEAAVRVDLQVRRVEPAHLHLHARAQLGEAAAVACQAAVGELEDQVLRREATRRRARIAAPVPGVADLSAHHVALAPSIGAKK
jgi:hypothetical protein